MWTSSDGRTWERIGAHPDDGDPATRYLSWASASGPDGLLVFGEGSTSRGLGEPAHTGFLTRDGVSWSAPIPGTEVTPVAAVHGNVVVMAKRPDDPAAAGGCDPLIPTGR